MLVFYLFFVPAAVFPGSEKVTIYFYTSETSINNFASLKMEFDRYLSQYGAYEIQPFKDRATFEKKIQETGNGLVLLSSWHYQDIHTTVHLKPALIGMVGGRMTQNRILVGQTIPGSNGFTGSVSSAADEQLTRFLCNKLMPAQDTGIKSLRVLTVPKDIDALMSVGFGISNMALTTENAFDKLRRVNLTLHRKMKVLARGQATFLPVVAILSEGNERVDHLLRVIEKMPQSEEGRSRIAMLGLEGWHKVCPMDIKKLEYHNGQTD